jgi:predicted nucleic acid-binding protein
LKLVDTSVAVDHLRGYASAVVLLEGLVEAREELLASELTRYELRAGVRAKETGALSRFFTALRWVPVDAEIAEAGGDLARRYRKTHPTIDDVDYLIAGTAVLTGAELLTLNVRHFPMFVELQAPY